MKKYFLSACAILLAVGFTAFKTLSGTVTYQYTNGTFVVGVSSASLLNDANNWATGVPTCTDNTNNVGLCKAFVSYPGASAPTEQQIIDAIKAEYDALALVSQTFSDGYFFQPTIGSQTVDITIDLRHVAP